MTLLNNITYITPGGGETMFTFSNFDSNCPDNKCEFILLVRMDNSTVVNGTYTGSNSVSEISFILGYLLQPNEVKNSNIIGTHGQIFAININSSLNTYQFALTPKLGGRVNAFAFINELFYFYSPQQFLSDQQKIYSFATDSTTNLLLTTIITVPSEYSSAIQNFDIVVYGNVTLNYSLVLFYVIVYIGIVSLIVVAGVMVRVSLYNYLFSSYFRDVAPHLEMTIKLMNRTF